MLAGSCGGKSLLAEGGGRQGLAVEGSRWLADIHPAVWDKLTLEEVRQSREEVGLVAVGIAPSGSHCWWWLLQR